MSRKQHGRHEIYPGSGNHFSSENVPSNYYIPGYVPQSISSTELNRPPVNIHMTRRDRGLGQNRVGAAEDSHESTLPYGQQRNQIDHNQEQEDEEKPHKPRNVWWYTVCRVFSAILIILNVTFDWIEYTDIVDPIEDNDKYCKEEFDLGEVANQFLYVCIAGTILAILQMVNIVYQIVQNHRLDPTEEIPNHLDERTEVFLVTTFIEIPQNFLLFRYEKLICLKCEVEWDSKTSKRFMNGLVACLSSIWRYITNIKVSAGEKSDGCCRNPCQKCGDCFGNCIKKFCNGLLKCLCPCCCCCFDCKTFFPCCCCSIIRENGNCYAKCCCNGNSCKSNPNEPSILADLAAIPTALHIFLYTARAMKNFCSLSGIYPVYNFIPKIINDTIISWLWDLVF